MVYYENVHPSIRLKLTTPLDMHIHYCVFCSFAASNLNMSSTTDCPNDSKYPKLVSCMLLIANTHITLYNKFYCKKPAEMH